VRVKRPPSEQLTAIGRQRAARMAPTVSVRSYAVAFTPDLLVGKRIVRGRVETTLVDGTHHGQPTARFCVSRNCGVEFPKVD